MQLFIIISFISLHKLKLFRHLTAESLENYLYLKIYDHV